MSSFRSQLAEYENVIAAAVESARGRLPVVAGVGYGTALAIEFAKRAEKAGADGILLLPHYLIQVEQEGLYRHIAAICRAVGIGAIVYHRDNCLLELDTVRRLADACPNLIGFKDGHGNVEQLTCLRDTLGDRLALCRRDADGGSFRRRQSGDRHFDVFLRDLQFRS